MFPKAPVNFLDSLFDFTSRLIWVQPENINLQIGPLVTRAKIGDVLLNLSQIQFFLLGGQLLLDRAGVYIVEPDPLQDVFRLVGNRCSDSIGFFYCQQVSFPSGRSAARLSHSPGSLDGSANAP